MGNELVTPDNIATTISTFQSTAALINSNEGLTLLLSFLGLSGYSLRDFKGKFNLAKFREKFKKEFPEGTKNEKQESILSNSLVELQNYIKNNENLDDNVFEKIGDIIINGIKTEDILTREYIKILKNLSWIDLSVFLKIEEIKINPQDFQIDNSCASFGVSSYKPLKFIFIEKLKKNDNYPKEIIEISLQNLINFQLISRNPKSTEEKNFIKKIKWRSDLGDSIFYLLQPKQ